MAQILPIRFQEHIQVVIFWKLRTTFNYAGANVLPLGNAPLSFDFFDIVTTFVDIVAVSGPRKRLIKVNFLALTCLQ